MAERETETSTEKWEQFFSSLLSILDEYEQQDHTTNISVRENLLARLECAVSALNQALPLASGVSASDEPVNAVLLLAPPFS